MRATIQMHRMPDIRQKREAGLESREASRSRQYGRGQGGDLGYSANRLS